VTSKSGFDMGAVRVLPPILRVFFIIYFTQIWTIIFTTLLCVARLFEFTACVYTSSVILLLACRKSSWTVLTSFSV
jgi:hypothetical protein